MIYTIVDVLSNLHDGQWFGFQKSKDKIYENLLIHDSEYEKPLKDFLNNELQRLNSGEPLRLLREQRNQIISATDWQASSDLTMTAEQTAYRQALRDLPTTATPSLDEDGQLTGVIWPTKPE
tara:strand:- start:16 stop:381 length:366 start_codon:yes stop_codon:yes gene_type:complete